ncbi:hypothetical protein [Roseovarius amoyensis]|uniref:hypothetical protein n=1 Tax=Roseovarius amoyensis TaxID=2211448 RepID=UPI0013A68DDA|nr:hypothetical protein [Roseovarius amoyensis]
MLVNVPKETKEIFIHLGPHRTGSTAIQKCLNANASFLRQNGAYFLHDAYTHQAAISLAREDFKEAEQQLAAIGERLSEVPEARVILSQEDFCGELPGRSRGKRIYPYLTKNLRIISRALRPHSVKFIFFVRNEDDWLKSCYHQHLKYRTMFADFESFRYHLGGHLSWEEKLEKPRATFKEKFKTLPYNEERSAGVTSLLQMIGSRSRGLHMPPSYVNSSTAGDVTRRLERINALSSFKDTAWFSKSLVMHGWSPRPLSHHANPPFENPSEIAALALPELTQRAEKRVQQQDVKDILPEKATDLSSYVFDILPEDIEQPSVSRIDMCNQSRILDYHLRGKSRLAKLNSLTISYLRRDTVHTEKAKYLFHRIWFEYGVLLVNELSTRWLISTLQTFLDHGLNEAQRTIGASGYFYANMMKIYEGERAIEGREQDAIYSETKSQTKNRFAGLDRYNVGGTDLLLNTNALALDIARRDDIAGLVLTELLLRTKCSHNVFTRMDKTRKGKGISVRGFEDTWSFFVEP